MTSGVEADRLLTGGRGAAFLDGCGSMPAVEGRASELLVAFTQRSVAFQAAADPLIAADFEEDAVGVERLPTTRG